jgi:hypothetical protein
MFSFPMPPEEAGPGAFKRPIGLSRGIGGALAANSPPSFFQSSSHFWRLHLRGRCCFGLASLGRKQMSNISEPGAAATREAWMRICRRLRLEDVFSSWFGRESINVTWQISDHVIPNAYAVFKAGPIPHELCVGA